MKKLIVAMCITTMTLTACGKSEAEKQRDALYQQQIATAQAQQQAAQAQMVSTQTQQVATQQPQPVIVQTPPADHSLAMGMLMGAAAYAAFDHLGHVRSGYVVIDGRPYHDSGYAHSYATSHPTQVTKIVKVTNVTNNVTVNKTVAPTAPAVAPKVKNAGDATAEKERIKMKAEADAKAVRDAKNSSTGIADRKAALMASKEKRMKSTSGFNSMSKRGKK